MFPSAKVDCLESSFRLGSAAKVLLLEWWYFSYCLFLSTHPSVVV